jgi:hypothetical protein
MAQVKVIGLKQYYPETPLLQRFHQRKCLKADKQIGRASNDHQQSPLNQSLGGTVLLPKRIQHFINHSFHSVKQTSRSREYAMMPPHLGVSLPQSSLFCRTSFHPTSTYILALRLCGVVPKCTHDNVDLDNFPPTVA